MYASAAIQSKTRPFGRRPQNTTVQIWYLNTFSDLFTVEIEPSCIEHLLSGAMLLVRIVGSPPHDKSEAILLVNEVIMNFSDWQDVKIQLPAKCSASRKCSAVFTLCDLVWQRYLDVM